MEDIKGIPDVDLSPILDELGKDAQQDTQQKQQQQQQPQQQRNEFGQFKSSEDVLKGYKEVQSFATKVSQENKALKEQMQSLQEQVELSRLSQQQTYYPQQQQQQQQQYQEGQEPNMDQLIEQKVTVREIANVLEEEAEKNRGEFQERYAYAQMVSRQYPQLSTTRLGVRKLFQLGDKFRQENLKKNANRALESILGSPLGEEEINKLRTLVKGDKAIMQKQQFDTNAYMPDTSTSTRSGQDQNRNPNFDTDIEESVKKGDVDGTIKGIFSKILAE